jgi:ubiquitin carboxyl-terminal hydrolase 34
MTINMKSPTITDNRPTTPEDNPGEEPAADTSTKPGGDEPTNVVSLSSTPTQSPEIEVAELEDMDQDPNTTSWRSLGEALRDPLVPDVVQLREQVYLPDTFPVVEHDHEPHENLDDMCAVFEKGMDPAIFDYQQYCGHELSLSSRPRTRQLILDCGEAVV